MSTETIDDDKNTPLGNTETPLNAQSIEDAQSASEKAILDTASKIKGDLTEILGDEEIIKNHKGAVLGSIQNYVDQISGIIEGGGSEEYLSALGDFKDFLEKNRDQILSTLTSEEKAELDKPKSTGTGASNKDAYQANRNIGMRGKKKTRMF